MKALPFLLLFLSSTLRGAEQPAVLDYARKVQERTEMLERAYLDRNQETVYELFPETNLLRFYLDVTGDGTPELFLSNTLDAEATAPWEVLQLRGNSYVKTASNVVLNPRGFYAQQSGTGMEVAGYERGEDLKYNIIGYRFTATAEAKSASKQLDENQRELIRKGGAEGRKRLGLVQMQRPAVEIVSAKNYLLHPDPLWLPFDRDHAPRDQVVEPNRSSKIAANERHVSKDQKPMLGSGARNTATTLSLPLSGKRESSPGSSYNLGGYLLAGFLAVAASFFLVHRRAETKK